MSPAIQISSVSKTFGSVKALDNVSLSINKGEIVALIGPSGSGKSTLLRHIAGLEISDKSIKKPRNKNTEGDNQILINDQSIPKNGNISKSSRKIRTGIGVIFQQFNLINRLSVMTNVLIGALGSIPVWRGTLGFFSQAEKLKALGALDTVGLKHLAMQRASTLSGGQQQRVAIASTLMQGANIVLADEPIASLDPKSAKTVMKTLRKMQRKYDKTVVVTLHQVDYARKYCNRVIALVDGKVAFDGAVDELTDEVLNGLYGTSFQVSDDEDEEDIDDDLSSISYESKPSSSQDLSYDGIGLQKTA